MVSLANNMALNEFQQIGLEGIEDQDLEEEETDYVNDYDDEEDDEDEDEEDKEEDN